MFNDEATRSLSTLLSRCASFHLWIPSPVIRSQLYTMKPNSLATLATSNAPIFWKFRAAASIKSWWKPLESSENQKVSTRNYTPQKTEICQALLEKLFFFCDFCQQLLSSLLRNCERERKLLRHAAFVTYLGFQFIFENKYWSRRQRRGLLLLQTRIFLQEETSKKKFRAVAPEFLSYLMQL